MASIKRALILEDHPGLGAMIQDTFRLGGYEVTLATNGRHGLEYAKQGGYDVIISDLKMPEIDGMTFLRALKENPPKNPNGPIVVYSNFAYEYSKDEVFALGASAFIAKDTLGTNELLEKINSLIEAHRANQTSPSTSASSGQLPQNP